LGGRSATPIYVTASITAAVNTLLLARDYAEWLRNDQLSDALFSSSPKLQEGLLQLSPRGLDGVEAGQD